MPGRYGVLSLPTVMLVRRRRAEGDSRRRTPARPLRARVRGLAAGRVADPRVEQRVEQVDHEVDEQDHRRDEDDDAEDDGKVAAAERRDQQPSDPGQAERPLDEDGAGEGEPDVHPEHRHERQRGVAEHLRSQDPPLAHPDRARRADVVGVVDLEHAGPDHPRVDRREDGAERDPRQQQVVGPLDRPAAELVRREDGAVAADRRPPEPEAEDVREHQRDPERMRRHADQHEDHPAAVEQRARAQRRQDPDRDRDQEPDQDASEHEREGDRRGPRDHVDDVLVRPRRRAEVAVQHMRDERAVLAHDGAAVDPDGVAQRRPLVAAEAAPDRLVVPRDQEEEDVRVERQGEEEDDRPREPPEHEAEHLRASLLLS